MQTIPLKQAMIVWDNSPPKAEPSVKVIDIENGEDDNRYSSSWGACNIEFQKADDDGRLLQLFVKYHQLVHLYDQDLRQVHEAFMVIPEYRQALVEAGSIDPRSVPEGEGY